MEQTDQLDLISSLPEELSHKIFASLDVNSLLKSQRVNKIWKSLMDTYFWKTKCKENYFQEVEQNRYGYKKCCKRHIHWKGVFLYHHTLRKNWLTKSFTTSHEERKGMRILRCSDKNIIEVNDYNGTINIINSYGKIFRTIQDDGQSVLFAKLEDDYLLILYVDKKLVLWKVDSVQRIWSFDCSTTFNIAVDFCNDKIAINAKYPNVVHLMNTKSKKVIFRLKHNFRVTRINFYENKLVCGCQDGFIEVWNINDGKLIYAFQNYKMAEIADVSINGTYAMSRSTNNVILVWNIHTGEKLHNLMGTMATFLKKNTLMIVEENSKFFTVFDCKSGIYAMRIDNEENVQQITANTKFIFIKSKSYIKMYNLLNMKLENIDNTLCVKPEPTLFLEASDTKLAVTFSAEEFLTSQILDFDVDTCN